MEDETTIKMLEIIKGIKERLDGVEGRQREFSASLASLEARANEIVAASGNEGIDDDIKNELASLREKIHHVESGVENEIKNISLEKLSGHEKRLR